MDHSSYPLQPTSVRTTQESQSKPATKQEAMDLFEEKRKEFLSLCRWVAVKIAKKQGNVTIDDVRKECPLPLNIDGRVYGAVFNSPEFTLSRYTKTKIKTSHGRIVGVYILSPEYRIYSKEVGDHLQLGIL